ncbi:hypothetical protein [Streptomyces californicus]|uniref:hypothetical protein n=1 Tax=Streptomyces californicus TaxID=67351 RepID=UPI0036D0E357
MLQCTAFCELPEMGARIALMGLEELPGHEVEAPDLDTFLLCELGEHDEATEHAAQLWSASPKAGRDLWMFWLDGEERRTFRFAELLPCPAVVHRLSVKEGEACMLYDRHPGAHSWDVVDPLADLMTERVRDEVRRERESGGGEEKGGEDEQGSDRDGGGGGDVGPGGGA